MTEFFNELNRISLEDVAKLKKAAESYGDSWKKRGGVGAYMAAIRKIDRIEVQVEKHGYDVFKAVELDQRAEGIIDDIQDFRRYLLLWEAELRMRLPNLGNKPSPEGVKAVIPGQPRGFNPEEDVL